MTRPVNTRDLLPMGGGLPDPHNPNPNQPGPPPEPGPITPKPPDLPPLPDFEPLPSPVVPPP
ncbi:MAG: hypothetical protein ABL893_20245 [Hyphomicrobium sp.]|nr:hypothetical protein [Hyphomicrobium sp.]